MRRSLLRRTHVTAEAIEVLQVAFKPFIFRSQVSTSPEAECPNRALSFRIVLVEFFDCDILRPLAAVQCVV